MLISFLFFFQMCNKTGSYASLFNVIITMEGNAALQHSGYRKTLYVSLEGSNGSGYD